MYRALHSLLGLVRFSHTIFALPFALTGAALAWRKPPGFQWTQLGAILVCMVFGRSAAMAFNRIVDRRLDAANPRTANRHLPSGQLTVVTAWIFTAVCVLGFFASTLIFYAGYDNPWPLVLAAPVLIFVGAYSFAKRFTALAHFWLGASLLLAPLSAWIAIRGCEDLAVPVLLGGAVLFWVAGFDILYACQDVDFDRRTKLHSVPAALGVPASLRMALLCHLVMLGFLAALAFAAGMGTIYWTGLAAIAALLAYEHWLVRPNDLSRVNEAFFQVNAIISIGLFVVVLLQLAVDG